MSISTLWMLAQEAAPAGGFVQMLPMLVGLFLIMYLLVIRPSRKQEQQRLAMLAAVKKNDKVLTTGGIYGVVTSVKDNELTLRIDEEKNVRIRVARHAISHIVTGDGSELTAPATAGAPR